jgi:hypothetical protein
MYSPSSISHHRGHHHGHHLQLRKSCGSASSSTQQPRTFNEEFRKDPIQSTIYGYDAGLRQQHVLDAV